MDWPSAGLDVGQQILRWPHCPTAPRVQADAKVDGLIGVPFDVLQVIVTDVRNVLFNRFEELLGSSYQQTSRESRKNAEMVRKGIPRKTAMMISGHETESVFNRYTIIEQADIRKAVEQVEAKRAENLDNF